jgi:hypothetical protein
MAQEFGRGHPGEEDPTRARRFTPGREARPISTIAYWGPLVVLVVVIAVALAYCQSR